MQEKDLGEEIVELEEEIPVSRELDVLVVGGGTGGVVAAIAAAGNGAETLLLEYQSFLGGCTTGGLVTKPTGPIDYGIARELYDRVKEEGGAAGHFMLHRRRDGRQGFGHLQTRSFLKLFRLRWLRKVEPMFCSIMT